jgi:hypothetical protein
LVVLAVYAVFKGGTMFSHRAVCMGCIISTGSLLLLLVLQSGCHSDFSRFQRFFDGVSSGPNTYRFVAMDASPWGGENAFDSLGDSTVLAKAFKDALAAQITQVDSLYPAPANTQPLLDFLYKLRIKVTGDDSEVRTDVRTTLTVLLHAEGKELWRQTAVKSFVGSDPTGSVRGRKRVRSYDLPGPAILNAIAIERAGLAGVELGGALQRAWRRRSMATGDTDDK